MSETKLNFAPIPLAAVGVTTSWLVGYLGYSFFLVLVLVPVFVTTLNVIVNRHLRAKLKAFQAEQPKTYPEQESIEWLNEIFIKVWRNYSLFIAGMLVQKIEPVLKAQKPSVLSDIGFSKFDLGTLPFQIYNFKVVENKEKTLVLEVNFRWKSDFEIILYAKMAMVSPDVLVQDLELDATARVTITFTDNAMPIASKVKLQLTEKPFIDIGVSPIASAMDIMDLPVLSSWIKSLITQQVVARLCPPEAIEVDLEAIMEAQKNKPPSEEPKLSLKEKISLAAKVGNGVGAAGNVGASAIQGVGSGVMAVGQGVGNLAKGVGKGLGGLGKSITGLGRSSHAADAAVEATAAT